MTPRDRAGRSRHSEGTSVENSLETTGSQRKRGAELKLKLTVSSFSALSNGALGSVPSCLKPRTSFPICATGNALDNNLSI